jgi:glycosyltransferase involved in cell wall biosynthesis
VDGQQVNPSSDRPRIAILWQGLSGYAHASFRGLEAAGADLLVYHSALGSSAPFDDRVVTQGLETRVWQGSPPAVELAQAVDRFEPHALLVSSWHIHAYRRLARQRRGRTLRVLCMDNQWWATPKQRVGVLTAPLAVRPAYDAAFVPGERSADFARRLGFPDERIIRGIYTADHPTFDAVAEARGDTPPARAFLFVGRLVAEKGIDVLADGYRTYRDLADDPWPLLVGGTGSERERLEGVTGVRPLGFVQPGDLPAVLARAGCLVLPSRFEPWGVVVHEATAAGLPVVCTSVCGAASRLVLDGYNGAVVSPGDPAALARAMLRISRATDDERRAMSSASRSLARQFTPARWARHLLTRIGELRGLVGLPAMPRPLPRPGDPARVEAPPVSRGAS